MHHLEISKLPDFKDHSFGRREGALFTGGGVTLKGIGGNIFSPSGGGGASFKASRISKEMLVFLDSWDPEKMQQELLI